MCEMSAAGVTSNAGLKTRAPSAATRVPPTCVISSAARSSMGIISPVGIARSTVLDGAMVMDHGFVGAGAVVPPGKKVLAGELWLGNPAKPVRHLSDKEIEQLYYSAKHYVRLKDEYLAG